MLTTAKLRADYIIVGGGSAGSVLAHRLSVDPSIEVLLFESGPPSMGIKSVVPASSYLMMGDPKADWCYMGEPDASLGGLCASSSSAVKNRESSAQLLT